MAAIRTIDEKSDIDQPEALVLETKSQGSSEAPGWTAEEETAVRRKLDWQLVPTVTFLYLLCFLDRINIGNARIQGMQEDLNLVGYRFNIATSIFYVVYLVVEVPSNILLKRVGPRFYLPGLVVGFGAVSIATAFVRSYEQLCAVRALLGIFEGGTMPGLAFFLSSFYKREELYFRIGIYVSAASLAGAFGGLLAAGFSQIPDWGIAGSRLHTWRNIFFFEGIITVLFAAFAPIILPQSPETSRVLTDREKWIASERLRLEHKASSNEKVQMRHVKRAMLNINNYICAAGFFSINVTVQGLSVFMPTLLRELGWQSLTAQYYTVPVYVAASLIAIAVGFVSDKTRMRGIYLAVFTFLGITGFAILRWGSGNHLKYAAVYLCAVGAFPGGPGFLSWGINNSAGPAVRAVSSSWIVTLGTMGGILAVWAYLPNDGPSFPIGHTINLVAQICALLLSTGGIAYCLWENRVRARGGRDSRLVGLTEQEKAGLGYRHPDFRYIA
ncbi:MFS general substrate transporter [Daldinia decipiens]|uniref:MFS general substrate transporter n=1 Tax=Daldinia decipiens TaxID=326647 RepID=UPI0020C389B1|nr:MFS general substrate transporter [Daldinia decipiens]KAI1655605.1 MFS general substrate transporter [Daldinia decipiens]